MVNNLFYLLIKLTWKKDDLCPILNVWISFIGAVLFCFTYLTTSLIQSSWFRRPIIQTQNTLTCRCADIMRCNRKPIRTLFDAKSMFILWFDWLVLRDPTVASKVKLLREAEAKTVSTWRTNMCYSFRSLIGVQRVKQVLAHMQSVTDNEIKTDPGQSFADFLCFSFLPCILEGSLLLVPGCLCCAWVLRPCCNAAFIYLYISRPVTSCRSCLMRLCSASRLWVRLLWPVNFCVSSSVDGLTRCLLPIWAILSFH